jgi:hypothetical protein
MTIQLEGSKFKNGSMLTLPYQFNILKVKEGSISHPLLKRKLALYADKH